MKFISLVTSFVLYNVLAFGQYNNLYQHYYTPITGQALTVIDENNVQFDASGKIYTLMDRESLRYSILTCLNNSGVVDWIDTLKLMPYLQSSNANFKLSDNSIYAICTHGYNLNSSNAEAVAITKFNLNGNIIHQKVLTNPPNINFRSQEIYVQPNSNIIATYLTNDAMTNWTFHVDCLDSALNAKWSKSFAWPSYSPTSTPGTLDNMSNFYVSYTTDSIVTGNYYRKAFLHKIDSSGNINWTTNEYDKRYKFLKMSFNGLVIAGETIAPLVIVSNNIGDVFVKKVNTTNGVQAWDTVYNATSNEKEIVNSLDIGINTNIIIGGTQDIQDAGAAHHKGFFNIYTFTGMMIQNTVKPTLEIVNATRFLNGGNAVVRSSTATDLHINEYSPAGAFLTTTNLNFLNGASWAGMDILPNDDIALAVSDVLCVDRGVTAIKLSKTPLEVNPQNIKNPIISLFPNPSNNQIQLVTDFNINSVKAFNILGQEIEILSLFNNKYDISYLPNGIYSLLINTNKGNNYLKLIKN